MLSRFFTWSLLLIIGSLETISPVSAQFLSTIPDFDYLNKTRVDEQISVQTDCEVYAPGDTIWFKAYIRNKATLKPSDLSQVFYVNLVNHEGIILSDEKYLVSNSQSTGYLVVDNSLEEGFYSMDCYSAWMKNFGPGAVYKKRILILKETTRNYKYLPSYNKKGYEPGDTVKIKIKAYNNFKQELKSLKFRYRFLVDDKVIEKGSGISSVTDNEPLSVVLPGGDIHKATLNIFDDRNSFDFDVPVIKGIEIDFFPEGGHSLIDRSNIVAFKATYSSCVAVDLKGKIVTADGTTVTEIKTDYNGTGRFLYMPKDNKKYFLKIIEPLGYDQLYELPDALSQGWGMQAQTTNKVINVKVTCNTENPDTCLFMLSIRGFTHFFRMVSSEPETNFSIPTDKLPAGVAVLTLLNRNNLPQAERLVFVNYKSFILADLSTEYKKYLCRDAVTLNIDLKNSNQESGQYSLSVYDDVFGSSDLLDEPNIIAANYLSPEIKGPIPDLNYFFNEPGSLKFYQLDLLLMTQGWRNYKYLETTLKGDTVKMPENQDVVRGEMKRFKFGHDPVPTSGTILVYFAGSSQKIITDDKGSFSFLPVYTAANTSSIVISGSDKKGEEGIIIHTSAFDFRNAFKDYLKNSIDSSYNYNLGKTDIFGDNTKQFFIDKSKSIWIDEVEIRSKKSEPVDDVEISLAKNFANVKKSSLSLLKSSKELQEILENMGYYCTDEEDYLQVDYRGSQYKAKFIIDGMDKGDYFPSIRDSYKPEEIKNLYVLTGNEASLVYGNGFVVLIQTDKDAYKHYLYEDNNTSSITIKALQVQKEFYSPKYLTDEEKAVTIPDLRKTLYFNPDVKVDSTGKAIITFYNSDRYTRFKCVFEGITDSGIPVYGEKYYEISTSRE